jgi:hypothetical protein
MVDWTQDIGAYLKHDTRAYAPYFFMSQTGPLKTGKRYAVAYTTPSPNRACHSTGIFLESL